MTVEPSTISLGQKRVHVETWGCQMNVADSEKMLGLLYKENYELATNESEADLIILNTCHIREKATHKVLSRLGRLREAKSKNPSLKIAVTGCVAQAEGKKLLERSDLIDILIGPGKIDDLPAILKSQQDQGSKSMALGFNKEPAPEMAVAANPTLTGKSEVTRYININQGCNNFCTFCVVPYTRGREISRLPRDIIAEVESAVAQGAREVTLLGQNVNSYGLDLVEQHDQVGDGPFVSLLQGVSAVKGLDRLRFTTSNPHDFTKPLADLFFTESKLGSYLHLPVQSGNDEVLARMRRKVTREEFLTRVGWLRDRDPNFALSTDLIVGFPGETEAQFEDTLSLVEQVRFSFIFAFKYSPRKHTAAAKFRDQLSEEDKSRRLHLLNKLQDKITIELNVAQIGKEVEVLCHYRSQKDPGCYYSRTPDFRLVRMNSDRNLVGQKVMVKIVDGNKTALVGDVLSV
ncbi:MAG: tRNA (N6-isopentenyl adenosine(37)-C2)-methylthiotransferase MiaB [Oligoflexales bacterium]